MYHFKIKHTNDRVRLAQFIHIHVGRDKCSFLKIVKLKVSDNRYVYGFENCFFPITSQFSTLSIQTTYIIFQL